MDRYCIFCNAYFSRVRMFGTEIVNGINRHISKLLNMSRVALESVGI